MNDLGIVNRPDRIWNLDETSFCLDPSKTKVVGELVNLVQEQHMVQSVIIHLF